MFIVITWTRHNRHWAPRGRQNPNRVHYP